MAITAEVLTRCETRDHLDCDIPYRPGVYELAALPVDNATELYFFAVFDAINSSR